MAQKIWFTNDPVLMLHIDVEGDNKQVITRPATEQDKATYGAQLQEMQGGGGTAQGTAGQPGPAAQNSGQSGTTTREMQATQGQPGQTTAPAPSGATGQQDQPSGTNTPR